MGNPALTQIGKLQNRPDPLLNFKWVCQVLPFGLPSEYLESIDIPFNNIKVHDSVYGASGFTYYPGAHDVSGFNVTVYMDSKGTSLKWLMAWKARIKDFDTGVYQLPNVYKQSMKVDLLDTKNSVVITADLQGIWPSETSAFSLNYSDNGRLILTQGFSIDNVILSFP